MSRRIKIQPQEHADMTLPYPFFINEKGEVGRQDFWKGEPLKLLGFSNTSANGSMPLMRKEWLDDPQKAVGMYPVFMHKNKEWYTYKDPIESVKELEAANGNTNQSR